MRAEYGEDGASSLFRRVFLLVSYAQESPLHTHRLPRYIVSAYIERLIGDLPCLGIPALGRPS